MKIMQKFAFHLRSGKASNATFGLWICFACSWEDQESFLSAGHHLVPGIVVGARFVITVVKSGMGTCGEIDLLCSARGKKLSVSRLTQLSSWCGPD